MLAILCYNQSVRAWLGLDDEPRVSMGCSLASILARQAPAKAALEDIALTLSQRSYHCAWSTMQHRSRVQQGSTYSCTCNACQWQWLQIIAGHNPHASATKSFWASKRRTRQCCRRTFTHATCITRIDRSPTTRARQARSTGCLLRFWPRQSVSGGFIISRILACPRREWLSWPRAIDAPTNINR